MHSLALGVSDKMLFETANIESKKGECVYECLKMCGVDFKKLQDKVSPFALQNIEVLTSTIIKNELSIAVVANGFTMNKKTLDILERGRTPISIKDKKRTYDYECANVLKEDINFVYICGDEKSKHFIIYDEVNRHADYSNGKPKLLDNIYISANNKSLRIF